MPELNTRSNLFGSNDQSLIILGHVFFGGMLVMATLLYKERMLTFDAAFYTMRMLLEEGFISEHQRYVNWLAMPLPLLGIKAGASLKTIIILYSVGLILVHYVLWLIAVYGLRNPKAGAFMMLLMCMAVRNKYYMGVSELHISATFLGLFFAWITRPKDLLNRNWLWKILIPFAIVAAVSLGNPIAIIPLCIIIGGDIVVRSRWTDPEAWIQASIPLLMFGVKKYYFTFDDYENNKINLLIEAFGQWKNWLTFPSVDFYKHFLIHDAPLLLLLTFCVGAYLFFKKKWMELAYLLLMGAGYSLMITGVYYKGASINMQEGYYMFLPIFALLPMFYHFFQKNWKWTVLFCLILIGDGTARIIEKGNFFRERLAYYDKLEAHYLDDGHRKLLLPGDAFPLDLLWLHWTSSLETLLYTSLEGPEHAATVFYHNGENIDFILKDEQGYISVPWVPDVFPGNKLPERYFKLKTGTYLQPDPTYARFLKESYTGIRP
ncbi:MAG: hypothetical protein AAGI38_03785 [Bacteroidota bacterium]